MPRPPPPNAAFTRSGYPTAAPSAASAASDAPGSTVAPSRTGTPAAAIMRFASILEPIDAITDDGGPDEGEPRVLAGAGEPGMLGEEPVAGVHGVRAAAPRRVEEQVDAEVGVGRGGPVEPDDRVGVGDVGQVNVGVGAHRDGLGPPGLRRADHARRDLRPIGDEEPPDRAHIRKTP